MIPVFFAYFALMSMAAAVLTVALKNPVHCGLALLALLLHVSGLFVLLNAEFLWAVQVVVYAGAILVENAEDFGSPAAGRRHGVGNSRVELGGLARLERQLPLADPQPEAAVEDIEPLVPVVHAQLRERPGGGIGDLVG